MISKAVICNAAHQKGLHRLSQFRVFDALELFLNFKITPHLSKLIKAFKLIEEGSTILIVILITY